MMMMMVMMALDCTISAQAAQAVTLTAACGKQLIRSLYTLLG
jgi:hypothetical protein